jgi:hypothetical protein
MLRKSLLQIFRQTFHGRDGRALVPVILRPFIIVIAIAEETQLVALFHAHQTVELCIYMGRGNA